MIAGFDEDAQRFAREMREASDDLGRFFHGDAHFRWWVVYTSRGQWRYRYSVNRNKAGYFLGDIEFRATGNASFVTSGLFKRRVKKRVMEIQRERARKHRERTKRAKRR